MEINYNLDGEKIDVAIQHFRKALNISGEQSDVENVFISIAQKKKLSTEIQRLRVIARECRHDDTGVWAEEMIVLLEKKLP